MILLIGLLIGITFSINKLEFRNASLQGSKQAHYCRNIKILLGNLASVFVAGGIINIVFSVLIILNYFSGYGLYITNTIQLVMGINIIISCVFIGIGISLLIRVGKIPLTN